MRVSSTAGSLLLTGDIELQAEEELIAVYGEKLDVDVLIVPHHGSKTSSGRSFIDSVDAELAIFSVGYRNRYRLPNRHVVSRYESASAELMRTDRSGAITVNFSDHEGFDIEKYRQRSRRYWYHMQVPDR
jgi:competence protein ComEC